MGIINPKFGKYSFNAGVDVLSSVHMGGVSMASPFRKYRAGSMGGAQLFGQGRW